LSRHRKVQLSRSKAIVLAAAGALSVATAASATAATWSPAHPGPAESAGPAGRPGGHGYEAEAAGGLRLVATDQLAQPIADTARQQSAVPLAQRTYQLRLAETRFAIAQRKAAQKRAAEQAAKKAAVAAAARSATATATRPAPTGTAAPPASGSPRQIAQAMLASFGWSASQFSCLDPLWAHESGWSVSAYNAGSGAFGIPQALPGSRMASAGPDWQTNAATQIKWGLGYIKDTYGSPCAAWSHEEATGWY
jgi:hypothetical protein